MAAAKDYSAVVDPGSRFIFRIWLLGILRLFVVHFSLDAHLYVMTLRLRVEDVCVFCVCL